MKGVILAAGKGTRLYPLTKAISKPLLPVYDKPMIYYPLQTLRSLGIDEIMVITNARDYELFRNTIDDPKITYAIQYEQIGVADAFNIARDFIGNDSVCLILGDNIFIGEILVPKEIKGAYVLGYKVENPSNFGVVEVKDNKVISIEEKPKKPKSDTIIPGIYFYDNRVLDFVKHIKPSSRGELEITDINKMYLEIGELNIYMPLTLKWFDVGTFDSLLEASYYIRQIQDYSYKIDSLLL